MQSIYIYECTQLTLHIVKLLVTSVYPITWQKSEQTYLLGLHKNTNVLQKKLQKSCNKTFM